MDTFTDLLSRHDRVAIAGGPRTGKTTLAAEVDDRAVFHTDDWKHLKWEHQPLQLLRAVRHHERYVAEGVQVARALRKGLKVDALVVLTRPRRRQTKAQAALGKNVGRWLSEWIGSSRSEGVEVLWL